MPKFKKMLMVKVAKEDYFSQLASSVVTMSLTSSGESLALGFA